MVVVGLLSTFPPVNVVVFKIGAIFRGTSNAMHGPSHMGIATLVGQLLNNHLLDFLLVVEDLIVSTSFIKPSIFVTYLEKSIELINYQSRSLSRQ